MEDKELFAMQCSICGYVTTLVEAEYQYLKHCMKCGNKFESGSWKSIYKTTIPHSQNHE